MNPNAERYTLEFPGLVLELDCESYPGDGEPDIIGDSRWTFQREDLQRAGLLDPDPADGPGGPFLYAVISPYLKDIPLIEALAGDRFDWPEDAFARAPELESDQIDACIVTLRALMERAEERAEPGVAPWTVRVGWYGECSAFWLFHDITHAIEDVDYSDGFACIYLEGAWAEDRANLEGARRAVRAGVPVAEVLAELAGLRDAFRSRFAGEESTALADFLDGYTDTDGEKEHRKRVADLAADILDSLDEGVTEGDALERAWEYVDGAVGSMSDEESATVLVHTEHADRAEEYADGDSVDLASRAFGALLGDVESALLDAFRVRVCADCEERLPAPSVRVCADCARGYTDEERDEAERGYREEERAEELDALAEEEADLHAHAREPHAVRVLPLGAERVALLERLAADPDTSPEDRERVRRVLVREHTPEDAGDCARGRGDCARGRGDCARGRGDCARTRADRARWRTAPEDAPENSGMDSEALYSRIR